MDTVINLFENKGWGLYLVTVETNNNIETIVSNGKASKIEIGNYYHVLPFAFHHNDIREIFAHMENAQKTNQLPKYYGGSNQSFIIDGIELTNDFVYLHPAHTTNFRVKIEYDNLEETVKRGVSNYNIYYFNSLDALLNVISIPPQQETPLTGQLRWEYVWEENTGRIILYPSDPNPIFFRGQNKRYQPCFPSICRNISINSFSFSDLTEAEQSQLIIRLIKSDWFGELLEKTPQIKWAHGKNVYIDKIALAQHYELPTGLLDLTQSIDVACFFACCKYEDGTWHPMEDGEGIIYSLDARLCELNERRLRAIGQQVFPRPSEQWAWTYELTFGENFDLLPQVKKYIFKHNRETSTRILNKFFNGHSLFPFDPLFIIAEKVKRSNRIPVTNTLAMLRDLISDETTGLQRKTVDEILKQLSDTIEIADNEINIIDDDLIRQLEDTWNQRKDKFFDNCGARLVRTIKNSTQQ